MAPPCLKGRIADMKYGLDQENLLLRLQYWACNAGGSSELKRHFCFFRLPHPMLPSHEFKTPNL